MVGNMTSSPEPSHQHTLKYSPEKQTLSLPLTLELFPAQLQKDGQRLMTSKPGVQSGKWRPFCGEKTFFMLAN